LIRINHFFYGRLDGLQIHGEVNDYILNSVIFDELICLLFILFLEFKSVTKEVCKLPSFFSTVLFRRIDVNSTDFVTRYVLLVLGSLLDLWKWFSCCSSCKCFKIVYLIQLSLFQDFSSIPDEPLPHLEISLTSFFFTYFH